jgi:regulatory protein
VAPPPLTGRDGKAGRRAPRKATPRHLENAALWYLARYQATARALERVLLRRVERSARHHGTDAAEGRAFIADLIARYRRAGLLDDAAFARARAASLQARGVSQRRIRARLREKGAGEAEIDAALAALAGADPEANPDLAAARRTARRRRLGPFRGAAEREARREKDLAALARAGFSYDIARAVIDGDD